MKTLRYLALAVLALIAVRLAGRALRRSDEITRLLWVLIATIASVGASNTPKTRAVEQRVAALVSSAATTNANLATTTTAANNAQTTANNVQNTISTGDTGFANALGYGATSTGQPPACPLAGPAPTTPARPPLTRPGRRPARAAPPMSMITAGTGMTWAATPMISTATPMISAATPTPCPDYDRPPPDAAQGVRHGHNRCPVQGHQ